MQIISITMNTYQVINDDEIIPSLLASDSHRGGGIAIVISKSDRSSDGERISEARHTRGDERYVCGWGGNMNSNWDGTQTAPTLTQKNANGAQRMPDKENFNAVIEETDMETVVRRLTPTECERLQGFPDGWTDIGEWTDTKGKVHKESSDSARYKALGNSIAIPFWFYLLRRIAAQYERPATLGSLFDGIGGFPLCWERCNGKGTARWASEIEEFPIAVTKRHFGED